MCEGEGEGEGEGERGEELQNMQSQYVCLIKIKGKSTKPKEVYMHVITCLMKAPRVLMPRWRH